MPPTLTNRWHSAHLVVILLTTRITNNRVKMLLLFNYSNKTNINLSPHGRNKGKTNDAPTLAGFMSNLMIKKLKLFRSIYFLKSGPAHLSMLFVFGSTKGAGPEFFICHTQTKAA